MKIKNEIFSFIPKYIDGIILTSYILNDRDLWSYRSFILQIGIP